MSLKFIRDHVTHFAQIRRVHFDGTFLPLICNLLISLETNLPRGTYKMCGHTLHKGKDLGWESRCPREFSGCYNYLPWLYGTQTCIRRLIISVLRVSPSSIQKQRFYAIHNTVFIFHQVPLTAGWTETMLDEKFAQHFYATVGVESKFLGTARPKTPTPWALRCGEGQESLVIMTDSYWLVPSIFRCQYSWSSFQHKVDYNSILFKGMCKRA